MHQLILSWKWSLTFQNLIFFTNEIKSFSKGVSSFTGLGELNDFSLYHSGNQYIDLLYELMGQLVHGVVFNAEGYFWMELQALVCGSFLMSLSSLMLNLFWTWGWSWVRGFFKIGVPLGCLYFSHTKVCSQMTSNEDFIM